MRFADVDAVTVDAYGTLFDIADPVGALQAALAERGVERPPDVVERAFRAEVDYYLPRMLQGRDEESLARLRRDCAGVFLAAAEADVEPDEFIPAYLAALRPEPLAGAVATLERLRRHGLALALVSNADIGLLETIAALELAPLFDAVVPSPLAGAMKPDPAVLQLALARLGVRADRAVHVGDAPEDEQAAGAAGMRFARAPLATAFAAWT